MTNAVKTMMDTEIENIKRFGQYVDGVIDLIKKYIDNDFKGVNNPNDKGLIGEICTKGYYLELRLTVPLNCQVIIYKTSNVSRKYKRIMEFNNAYGKITGYTDGGEVMKLGLNEFDIALSQYAYCEWQKNIWRAPYTTESEVK